MELALLEEFYTQNFAIPTPLPLSEAKGKPLELASIRGRLCEFSSQGVQGVGSLAARYVWEAQQAGLWPVWVSQAGFPLAEDLQSCGIDLRALPMVRTQGLPQSFRAAERVMRSRVCGLVVVDVGTADYAPPAMMGRIMKLAQRTDTACVLLRTGAQRSNMSLSPLVSLRMKVSQRLEQTDHRSKTQGSHMCIDVQIVRDKKEGRRDGFTVVSAASPGAL